MRLARDQHSGCASLRPKYVSCVVAGGPAEVVAEWADFADGIENHCVAWCEHFAFCKLSDKSVESS